MPCNARNAIRAGMLQAIPQSTDAITKTAMPISITGLRPIRSENFAKIGTVTAWASKKIENSQGNWLNPPRSSTIEGTAVAKMVASMAISPTLSMMEPSTGPRSDRRPTPARVISDWAMTTGNRIRGLSIP